MTGAVVGGTSGAPAALARSRPPGTVPARLFRSGTRPSGMEPRTYLRVEGLAALAAALAVYVALDGPLWLLAVLALAPDLAMLGYLAGPRVGAATYNVVHTYALPLAVGGAGVWLDARLAMLVAAVWAAHIGADRAFGYGLKYESGFRETHLGAQPPPAAPLEKADRR